MDNNSEFEIFRHISLLPEQDNATGCIFVVSFKFARLSHKANKIISVIPMLLITGHPGFLTKMYAVNHNNGYWQGMYQWKSDQYLEAYKKSFVFKMMNKRAIPGSLSMMEISNMNLKDFIEENKVLKTDPVD
jgi:hypothetical protein